MFLRTAMLLVFDKNLLRLSPSHDRIEAGDETKLAGAAKYIITQNNPEQTSDL